MDLPGIGAILAGIGGVITAWIAIRKAKQEGSKTCHELLNESRLEAEHYAAELHIIKMKHPDMGLAALWMVASIGCFAAATALGMVAVDSGDTGPQGPKGEQGIQGTQGSPGINGLPGPPGIPGITGFQGAQGNQGNTGPQGPQGREGPQGIPGLNG